MALFAYEARGGSRRTGGRPCRHAHARTVLRVSAVLVLAFVTMAGCSAIPTNPHDVEEGCFSVDRCGPDCVACAAVQHGEAVCADEACSAACDSGYHLCAGACVDETRTDLCGEACTPCPEPRGERWTFVCARGACVERCRDGYLPCGDQCCEAPPSTTRLVAGAFHTCALDEQGRVRCWGRGQQGQIGDGSTTPQRLEPVTIPDFSAVQLGAGLLHTVARNSGGTVYRWGQDGTTTQATKPREAPETSPVLTVTAGGRSTCDILTTGEVTCWGTGYLGEGEPSTRSEPVRVPGLDSAYGIWISADEATSDMGAFTCVMTSATGLSCWGSNDHGQLGIGSQQTPRLTAAEVTVLPTMTRIRAVALGGAHTCVAYDTDRIAGGVLCWGRGAEGQLGDGAAVDRPSPVTVATVTAPLTGVVTLSSGFAHTCAVTQSGAMYCWGDNSAGQIGDGTTVQATRATPVADLSSRVTDIAAGGNHTCAFRTDELGDAEHLYCWGQGGWGEVGDGARKDRTTPSAVSGY